MLDSEVRIYVYSGSRLVDQMLIGGDVAMASHDGEPDIGVRIEVLF